MKRRAAILLLVLLSQPALAQWRVSSDQSVGGPADFTVVPGAGGSMTVVVPDLVQSQLRLIQLRK